MKFIEMSRFKALLTGCVLLLMLNCYQSYGDNFRVYYDTQSKTVKTERTPNQSETVIVDLSGIQTWETAAQIFEETRKITITNNNLFFLYNSGPIDPSQFSVMEEIVREENYTQEIEAFSTLSSLYMAHRKFPESEKSLNKVLRIAKEAKDPMQEANALNKLGILYNFQQDRLPVAEECYKNSLRIAKFVNNPFLAAKNLNELGTLYTQQGRLSDAERSLNEALGIAKEAKNPTLEAYALNGLGFLYAQQGRFPEAERCFNYALMAAMVAKHTFLVNVALSNLGKLHELQK